MECFYLSSDTSGAFHSCGSRCCTCRTPDDRPARKAPVINHPIPTMTRPFSLVGGEPARDTVRRTLTASAIRRAVASLPLEEPGHQVSPRTTAWEGDTQMRTAIVYADKHIGRHRAEDLDARCRMFASDHGLLVIETVYGHRETDVFGWTLAQIVRKDADVLVVPTIGHLRHHRLSEVTTVCDLMVVDSERVCVRQAEVGLT